MLAIIFSFLVSLVMIKVIIYTNDVHSQLTLDHDTSGVQKMHTTPVPRIGGLAIFVSLCFSALFGASMSATWAPYFAGVVASLFFVFVGGLTEDLSKSVSPIVRISFMAFAVLFATYVSDCLPMIRHLAIDNIDKALQLDLIAFSITCFAVVGVSNAYNIIDGFNGLSSTAAMINIIGIAYLAYLLNDLTIAKVSLSLFAAVLGFWIYNYPKGKIFMGDGGAYSLGFMVAILSIGLVEKHSTQISPYSVLLLAAYPITETVFTIARRKLVHKTSAMQPDNLHLHQLVFDRCISHSLPITLRNARVMPIMLLFMVPQLLIAVSFYQSNSIILLSIAGYIVYYIIFYLWLVKSKASKLVKLK